MAPPARYGLCSSVEPREFGGNMDNKELLAGTSVYFPVLVPGANFSAGDGHAVQGDGEVCLTALETCLRGTFEFTLHKGVSLGCAPGRNADPSGHDGASMPTSTMPPSSPCAR